MKKTYSGANPEINLFKRIAYFLSADFNLN